MKKLFLSVLLTALIVPAAFSFGLEFNFFSGPGITTGFTYGSENLHYSLGFIYDGSNPKIEVPLLFLGTTETEENASRYGAYYQFDYSFLPFKVSVFKFGFNAGIQAALVYSSVTKAHVDVLASPLIAAQATWQNLDVTLGWKGTAYIFQAIGKDTNNIEFKNWWANSFQIGVRYRFSSSGNSSGSSRASASNGTTDSGSVKVITGNTIRRTY